MANDLKEYFSGDEIIASEVKRIADSADIRLCIETGTWMAQTTEFLSTCFQKVITIESQENVFEEAKKRVEANLPNVQFIHGKSWVELEKIGFLIGAEKCFFFLDAHWYNPFPLPMELQALTRYEKPFILIHDYFIPGKSNPENPSGDWGYDSYGKERIDQGLVFPLLGKIYPEGFRTYTNAELEYTHPASRGALFVIPQ